jgi:hypothetical protein
MRTSVPETISTVNFLMLLHERILHKMVFSHGFFNTGICSFACQLAYSVWSDTSLWNQHALRLWKKDAKIYFFDIVHRFEEQWRSMIAFFM